MTVDLLIRDVLDRDPSQASLQNDGVSKVENAATLHYELSTFVCDGEYEAGLIRILEAYLEGLHLENQRSAWVSGFYGSGKSHLVKVLEALWRNDKQLNGQLPRDIAQLPDEIQNLLREVSNEAKRAGGIWSASGMLSESGDKSVRMLMLGIVYRAAGLSSDVGRARFRLWVRQRGWEDDIVQRIAAAGLDPEEEFDQYLVSPEIADAIHELSGSKSTDAETAQERWDAQFNRADLSIDDFEKALREILLLQSDDKKRIPLTLLVLDEVQQYIGQSGDRAQAMQEAIERIQSAFESKVLVVATGQNALTATANLQKLMGRFTVNVELSDKDVEEVVRKVVLRKKPEFEQQVRATINSVEGEIDRHLRTSKVGARNEDREYLVPDYPLLPTRSRFWAAVLHALDPTGTSAQLRSQLRITHSATGQVAGLPLGNVIPGDFIFDQISGGLQQSGALPREIVKLISDQSNGSDGRLRARLIQLIFLIEAVNRETAGNISDIGVRATADNLADLLVEDLRAGSDDLRRIIPTVLESLENDGKLTRGADGSYAIQTGESLKWNQEFQKQRQSLASSPETLGALRSRAIEELVREQASQIKPTQGKVSEARKLLPVFSNDQPATSSDPVVTMWVRDGWNTTQQRVATDARELGDSSSLILVFVPQRGAQELGTALEQFEASKRTLELLGGLTDSPEGKRAAEHFRFRMQEREAQYKSALRDLVADAVVYQAGGAEVPGGSLAEKLREATTSSLKRLFPQFAVADDPGWSKVFDRAKDGNAEPLRAIGYQGEESQHPVIREVRQAIPGGAGILWTDLRKRFQAVPYGWPQDAIDGAVATLVNANAVSATINGQDIQSKALTKQQASATRLVGEQVFPSQFELMQVRAICVEVFGTNIQTEQVRERARELVNELARMAKTASGEPPLPLSPNPVYLGELQNMAGNELVIRLAAEREQILADVKHWRALIDLIEKRKPAWDRVTRLAAYAAGLPGFEEVDRQLAAVRDNRALLDHPDPLEPQRVRLGEMLRSALRERFARYGGEYDQRLAALKATDEWPRISPDRQDQFLSGKALHPLHEPSISSDQDLLTALSVRSIEQWDDAIAALGSRFEAVYGFAVKDLEPTIVEVSLTKPVMRTKKEVDAWIEEIRSALYAHLEASHPVKVK